MSSRWASRSIPSSSFSSRRQAAAGDSRSRGTRRGCPSRCRRSYGPGARGRRGRTAPRRRSGRGEFGCGIAHVPTVRPVGQPEPGRSGQLQARLAALLAHPGQDQLAADEVMAHLFGCHPLGVKDDRQAVIAPVAGAVGAGDFQRVADPPLGRQPRGVQHRADVERDLHVAEFHRRVDLVDRDVGRAERGPHVVGVSAEPTCSFLGLVQECPGGRAVFCPRRGHGTGKEQRAIYRQHRPLCHA